MTIRLTWQEGAPDSSGDGFKIYRSVNGGAYSLIATLSLSTTQYDDSSVSAGNSYSYRVVEYSGSEESQAAEITVRISDQSVSASEGRSLRASLSRSQTLSGAEARSINVQLSRTQTVYSSEILSLSSLLQRNEAIASEDYCALACYLFPADNISLAEQHESRATVTANETFSLYEAPRTEAHILSDDQGLAEETRALYGQLAAEDVGITADLLEPVYATLVLSEALLSEETVELSSYLRRLDQGNVFESAPIIGVSVEDSVEAAEAQGIRSWLSLQDTGAPAEEQVSLLCSLLATDETLASEESAQSAQLSCLDTSALAETKEFLSALLSNDDQLGYLESSQASAYLASWDSLAPEEAVALSSYLSCRDQSNVFEDAPIIGILAEDFIEAAEAQQLHNWLTLQDAGDLSEEHASLLCLVLAADEVLGDEAFVIGILAEDSIEAAEAQQLHNWLALRDIGILEEQGFLLCSLLAADEVSTDEAFAQSALLSYLDASALIEAKESLSALSHSDDQLGCLECLQAGAYLASWDSLALEETKTLSAALNRTDTFSATELSDLLALIELLDVVSAYEAGGLLISRGDLVFVLEKSSLQAALTGYDRGQIDDVWLGLVFLIKEAIDSQEASCVYFRQFGQPWGWFSYKVEGMPSPEVKVPQALGQKGQPGKKKLANPQAIKVG